jgi:hypothetical protein
MNIGREIQSMSREGGAPVLISRTHDDPSMVPRLFERGLHYVTYDRDSGYHGPDLGSVGIHGTIGHVCACYGHVHTLDAWLHEAAVVRRNTGLSLIDMCDGDGLSIGERAARLHTWPCMMAWLRHGGSTSWRMATHRHLLMTSIRHGQNEPILWWMQHGGDIHETNAAGYTMGHMAAYYGNTRILKAWMEAGGDIMDTTGKGESILSSMIHGGTMDSMLEPWVAWGGCLPMAMSCDDIRKHVGRMRASVYPSRHPRCIVTRHFLDLMGPAKPRRMSTEVRNALQHPDGKALAYQMVPYLPPLLMATWLTICDEAWSCHA